jgi:hypothetical protein
MNGDGLINVSGLGDKLDFTSLVQFPDIPNLNQSFTFTELTDLSDFVDTLSVQDMGFPQCYLQYLIDSFNGYDDPALAPTQPTTATWLQRALWVQEHLGYEPGVFLFVF